MEEIRKLIRIVTNRADKNAFGVDLDAISAYPSLEEKLYLGAKEGRFLTDEDAARGLYDTDSTDHRFRMLKSRLKSKLMNLLFLVDFRDTRDKISWQYETESENHLQRARILFRNGEFEMTEKQLNKCLAISRECELTNITIDALRMLRTIYSERFKPTDYHRTTEELEEYLKIQIQEDKANNIYYLINMNLRKSLHSRKMNLEKAGEVVKQLEKIYGQCNSFNIYEKYYRMTIFYNELVGNFDKVVELTRKAETLLEEGKINQLRFDIRYNHYIRTYAYLRMKKYDEGLRAAAEGMEHFDRSSSNWFSHMENYMLLALHSKSFKLGHDLMQRVLRNPHMDKIPKKAQERWKLFHAYLNFVIPEHLPIDVINFDEFYISMTEYNKDKRGYNTAILILEFLHHLKAGNTDRMLDRIESLVTYMKRHFGDPGQHAREKLFIKMLKALISTNFDLDKARKKGRKYFVKLKEEVEPGDAFAEIEIIPYHQLWEHILQLLEKKQESVSV